MDKGDGTRVDIDDDTQMDNDDDIQVDNESIEPRGPWLGPTMCEIMWSQDL